MEAKAHNDITNKYAEEIKKAKHEGHIKRLLAKARSKGHLGKHVQVHNVSTIPNGNIRYSIGLYRAPYSPPATNPNGTVVENVVKDVAPDPNPTPPPATTPTPPPPLSQSNVVSEFLEHYGVKGMHWGVRRGRYAGGSGGSRSSRKSKSSGPVKMGLKPAWHSPPMKKIMAAPAPSANIHAGKKHGKYLSEDAQQIHEIRMKVKKHGVASLTNKDFETINRRVELQQKYAKAHPKQPSKMALVGKLAVAAALSNSGQKKIVNLIPSPYHANKIHDVLKIAAPIHGMDALIKKSLTPK